MVIRLAVPLPFAPVPPHLNPLLLSLSLDGTFAYMVGIGFVFGVSLCFGR